MTLFEKLLKAIFSQGDSCTEARLKPLNSFQIGMGLYLLGATLKILFLYLTNIFYCCSVYYPVHWFTCLALPGKKLVPYDNKVTLTVLNTITSPPWQAWPSTWVCLSNLRQWRALQEHRPVGPQSILPVPTQPPQWRRQGNVPVSCTIPMHTELPTDLQQCIMQSLSTLQMM